MQQPHNSFYIASEFLFSLQFCFALDQKKNCASCKTSKFVIQLVASWHYRCDNHHSYASSFSTPTYCTFYNEANPQLPWGCDSQSCPPTTYK